MERLLCILSGMNAGGAETFLMKIYRGLDRTQYQMDFCINVMEECFYEKEIEGLGGIIYRIPSKSKNLHEFKRQLTDIVHNNHYERVLRITSNAAGFMDLKIAKKAGASICIARSSNSSDGGSIKSIISHKIGQLLYNKYVDIRIAPSTLAAEYTFGADSVESGDAILINNGLDLGCFKYDDKARSLVRASLNIDDDILVVGHIGRFSIQKNHDYLLEIFKKIHQQQSKSVLLLVGDGELRDSIESKISQLELKEYVRLLGFRKDIPQLLSAMDIFVFPSFYEGMPNTVIEAQTTGLPCIISDRITPDADVIGLVQYLSIDNESIDKWVECGLADYKSNRLKAAEKMNEAGYGIDLVVKKFVEAVF